MTDRVKESRISTPAGLIYLIPLGCALISAVVIFITLTVLEGILFQQEIGKDPILPLLAALVVYIVVSIALLLAFRRQIKSQD